MGPVNTSVAAVRIGLKNEEFICLKSKQENSELDLVLSGTGDSIFMVESESKELTENVFLQAISFGKNKILPLLDLIREISACSSLENWDYHKRKIEEELNKKIKDGFENKLKSAYQIQVKKDRIEKIQLLKKEVNEIHLLENEKNLLEINEIFSDMEKDII